MGARASRRTGGSFAGPRSTEIADRQPMTCPGALPMPTSIMFSARRGHPPAGAARTPPHVPRRASRWRPGAPAGPQSHAVLPVPGLGRVRVVLGAL